MNRRQRLRLARIKGVLVITPPAVVLGLYLVGLALPIVHAEREEVSVRSSPETLWTVLTDLDAMPTWRQDLVALERLPEADGVVRWREVGRAGQTVAMERVESAPLERMVVQLADRSADRRWVYEITRSGARAKLSVTEERTVRNPLVRTLVQVFGGGRGRIEGLARDLEARLAGHRQQVAGNLEASDPGLPERP